MRLADLESSIHGFLFSSWHTLDFNNNDWEQSASSLIYFATFVTFFLFLFPLNPHIHSYLYTSSSLYKHNFQILEEIQTHTLWVEEIYNSWELTEITIKFWEKKYYFKKKCLRNWEARLVKAVLPPPPFDGLMALFPIGQNADLETRVSSPALGPKPLSMGWPPWFLTDIPWVCLNL